MTSTYEAISTTTLTNTTANVTFANITANYTDLTLIISGSQVSLEDIGVQLNNDTGSNYSITALIQDTPRSIRQSNTTAMYVGALGAGQSISIFEFMSYSNTTTNKTVINRSGDTSWTLYAKVGLWRSTAAINSIKLIAPNSFTSGTVITLYGIKAE